MSNEPILGQEAICPDGLGRVVDYSYNPGSSNIKQIRVATYAHNRECNWDAFNVKLLPIRGCKDKDLQWIHRVLESYLKDKVTSLGVDNAMLRLKELAGEE